MRILGLSAFYHDSAAALVVDGSVVAAAQEERFSRIKHDPNFPFQSVEYCLEQGDCKLEAVDFVVFYDKPFLKFERILETYLAYAPRGLRSFQASMPVWMKEKLFLKGELSKSLRVLNPSFDIKRLLFSEHHLSHAASAFFPSPFESAAVLTLDGVGEWATTSVAIGSGNQLQITKEINFPHSLGLLYSAFTYYTGFRVNSGEYKVMGLAPFGQPRFVSKIMENLIDVKPDGSFSLDMSFFDYCTGVRMTNAKFDNLFGRSPRSPAEELDQFHMDIAASIQAVTEEVMLRLTRSLRAATGEKNLCLAGGVALNCVANGKIMRDGAFKNIWVQPASGDAGGALGAALGAYYLHLKRSRKCREGVDQMRGAYLGPSFDEESIKHRLEAEGAIFRCLSESDIIDATCTALEKGLAVGWFQGRMEYGPRALGARSILGDPRSPTMQKALNLKVKYRESFRPFAPAILREDLADWFDVDIDSPYMSFVATIHERIVREINFDEEKISGLGKQDVVRSEIPAVTHVDQTARVQTVHAQTNSKFHALLTEFKNRTGCPILINTSFNVRGEPLVCNPEDAFRCFMGTGIDVLVVGNCLLRKEAQNVPLKTDFVRTFEPD